MLFADAGHTLNVSRYHSLVTVFNHPPARIKAGFSWLCAMSFFISRYHVHQVSKVVNIHRKTPAQGVVDPLSRRMMHSSGMYDGPLDSAKEIPLSTMADSDEQDAQFNNCPASSQVREGEESRSLQPTLDVGHLMSSVGHL